MPPTKLVKAAVFTALAIGAGYALLLVPNVELITVLVFCAGAWLGVGWGLLVGATAEFIFSVMHPLGSGLTFPPLLLAQVLSMGVAGLAGGLLRPLLLRLPRSLGSRLLFALIGLLLTFLYDALTTLSFPLAAGFDRSRTVAIFLSGIGFTLVHQLSNAVIFAIGLPRIISSPAFKAGT